MRASISLWSADARSVDAMLKRVGPAVDSFHIDLVTHAHAREPLLGPDLIAALHARTTAPIDVHLLVAEPARWIDPCIAAGASTIILACIGDDLRRLLQQIKAAGRRAALSLDVNDPVEIAMEHFDLIDEVIIMGAARDVRGADLHQAVPARVRRLIAARRLNSDTPDEPSVFVEGAVRENTLKMLSAAGSDGVVVGALVLGAADPRAVIRDIVAMTASSLA